MDMKLVRAVVKSLPSLPRRIVEARYPGVVVDGDLLSPGQIALLSYQVDRYCNASIFLHYSLLGDRSRTAQLLSPKLLVHKPFADNLVQVLNFCEFVYPRVEFARKISVQMGAEFLWGQWIHTTIERDLYTQGFWGEPHIESKYQIDRGLLAVRTQLKTALRDQDSYQLPQGFKHPKNSPFDLPTALLSITSKQAAETHDEDLSAVCSALIDSFATLQKSFTTIPYLLEDDSVFHTQRGLKLPKFKPNPPRGRGRPANGSIR
jgi:hypothetical protein